MEHSRIVLAALAIAFLAPAACSSSPEVTGSTRGQAVVATCNTAADCPGYGVANVTCSDWYAPGASECIIDYGSGSPACADGAGCYLDACHVGKTTCGDDGQAVCGGTAVAVPDGEACAGGGACLGGTCTPAGCGSSCVTDACTVGTVDCEPGLAPVCKSGDGATWAQPNAACPVPGGGPSGVCTFQGENEPFCAAPSAFLITSSSGLGLEVNETPDVIDTWTNASPVGTNSEWVFTGTVSSYGGIKNVAMGQCLDSGMSADLLPDGAFWTVPDGQSVAAATCLDPSNVDDSLQQWQLIEQVDGTYAIQLVGPLLTNSVALCLDNAGATQNGVVAVTHTCSGAASQKWRIAPVSPVQGCTIAGLTYAPDAINPGNPCESCQPSTSATSWTPQPSGWQICGASCVDTQDDAENCGACGNVCQNVAGSNGACTAGQCPVPPAQGCNIDGEVYPTGYVNPTNGCASCDPSQPTTSWTVGC